MAKTRQKKVIVQGISREQADEAFANYAAADARIQRLTAKIDEEITRIREKYQDELSKLQEVKEQSFEILQTFALEQKSILFSKKKSLETVHGTIGFRTGTPKLKTMKGFTWQAVTNLLKTFLPDYVRIIEEPAKDKLLADRENPKIAELMPKVGVYVHQEEIFYVEPKKEVVENII